MNVLSFTLEEYNALLERIKGVRLGIVGDLILDEYIYGIPRRLSREAPVPIIEYESSRYVPGGACNSASAAAAVAEAVYLFGFVGNDQNAKRLLPILQERKINTSGVIVVPDWHTVTKTRIMAGSIHTAKHQVVRIDKGTPLVGQKTLHERLAAAIHHAAPHIDAWLISDYGYMCVGKSVEEALKDIAAEGAVVVADSRWRIHDFSRITAVTPNEEEALEFGRYMLNFEKDVKRVGTSMLEILHLKYVLLTRGNRGMMLFSANEKTQEISVAGTTEIVDVSGAGDEVAALFTAGLGAGADPLMAAELANAAAGVVVMKRGTAVASPDEIRAKLEEVSHGGSPPNP